MAGMRIYSGFGATYSPAPSLPNRSFTIRQFVQGADPFCCTFPEAVSDDVARAATVGARLKGVPSSRANRVGVKIASHRMLSNVEFLLYRLDVCPRPSDGVCTPAIMREWFADVQGVVFDLWVGDVIAASIHTSYFHHALPRIPMVMGSLTPSEQPAISYFRLLWRRFLAGIRLFLQRRPVADYGQAVAIPVALKGGDELVIRCRFPRGWRASRKWDVTFVMLGIANERIQ